MENIVCKNCGSKLIKQEDCYVRENCGEKHPIQEEQVFAKTLPIKTLQTRELSIGIKVQTDITEQQTLSLIDTYIKLEQWEEAEKLVNDILSKNSVCTEALWKKLLIEKRAMDKETFAKRVTIANLPYLDKIISEAPQEMATKILDLLYNERTTASDAFYCEILKIVLPYRYEKREAQIKASFACAIANSLKMSFELLLTTLNSADVDSYIQYNLRYAKYAKTRAEKKEYLLRVLKIDEKNMEVLKMLLYTQLKDDDLPSAVLNTLGNILKYNFSKIQHTKSPW